MTAAEAVLDAFPILGGFPSSTIDRLLRSATTVSVDTGTRLMQPGDPCETCALVVEGELRIRTQSNAGRELTLYNVLPGEMCALTSLCLLTNQPFPAYVHAAAPTTVVVIPKAEFDQLIGSEDRWRQFAFSSAWTRVGDLLNRIDEVVFTDLPTRLADALLTAQEGGVAKVTHSDLAAATGSAREAVSRVLKRWENEGLIVLLRGRILLEHPDRLRAMGSR